MILIVYYELALTGFIPYSRIWGHLLGSLCGAIIILSVLAERPLGNNPVAFRFNAGMHLQWVVIIFTFSSTTFTHLNAKTAPENSPSGSYASRNTEPILIRYSAYSKLNSMEDLDHPVAHA